MILLSAYSPPLAKMTISILNKAHRGIHTSQLLKIKQRLPAMDFSGPKAPEDSFTIRRIDSAVAVAVDFNFNLFSSIVPCSS